MKALTKLGTHGRTKHKLLIQAFVFVRIGWRLGCLEFQNTFLHVSVFDVCNGLGKRVIFFQDRRLYFSLVTKIIHVLFSEELEKAAN